LFKFTLKRETLMEKEGKEYQHNGKTVKIIPAKRVKKTAENGSDEADTTKVSRVKRVKKADNGLPKYIVGNKVGLKNIPAEYAGAGFTESVVTKVFKSTHDQNYRYSIRAISGQELAMLKEEQLKPYK
jgi:hypothetical protein